jgi:hypothetical protein
MLQMAASNYKVSVIFGDTPKGVNMLLSSGAIPPVIKIHNNISHAQLIHEKLGNDTIIIVRLTGTEGVFNRSKAAAVNAVEWCTIMEPAFKQAPYVYWEAGPPLQPCDDWYCEWLLAAMDWCHARSYRLCVMTVGEGTPQVPSGGGDGWAPMWPVVQLAASYGYILGPQAYWVDGNMDPNDDWHMFRIYRAFRDYPGKWPVGTRIVFSECFIDLRNGLGWRTALGGDWPRARAGMKLLSNEINRRPCPPGVEVIGATNFAIHEVDNEWRDFNYLEYLMDQMTDIKAEQGIVEVPPPMTPPEPPPTSTGTIGVKTLASAGQNVRSKPSTVTSTNIVGSIEPGETVLIKSEDAASVGYNQAWIYVIKTANASEGGWALASLLRR